MIAMIFVSLMNCKKGKTADQVVNDKSIQSMPNGSDIKFAEGLKLMENEQQVKASKSIKEGIAELNKEAISINGREKEKLDSLSSHLNNLAGDLEKGNAVQISQVRNLIANAEIIVNHSYLSSDDLSIWADSQSAEVNTTFKKFNIILANLKNTESSVKEDAKKDHEALITEGEKLKAENDAWEKKISEFNKKADDHFKKNFPEFTYLN